MIALCNSLHFFFSFFYFQPRKVSKAKKKKIVGEKIYEKKKRFGIRKKVKKTLFLDTNV